MENKIDDLFKKKISSFETTPSAKAWEQLEGQLNSKKRKLWYGRFAVAASVVLLVGLAYIGFQTLDSVSVSNNSQRTDATEIISIEEGMGNTEENNSSEVITAPIENSETTPRVSTIENQAAKVEKKPIKVKNREAVKQSENIETSEDETVKTSIPNAESGMITEGNAEGVIIESSISEELAVNINSGQKEFIEPVIAETKTYPQVTITYKPSKQTEASVPDKKGLLNKGLNKITEFTDEHLLTEERKIKLRNTTEDVLALNFGKLINKSNREFEN